MNQDPRADEATTEDHDMDVEGKYDDQEYDEDDERLFDDEDEDDDDAEAVAKRLGDALWADISKAYAQRASEPAQVSDNQTSSNESDEERSLVAAIQTVLDLASDDPALNDVLSGTMIPGTENQTLLTTLIGTAETKEISPGLADILSNLVQSIADGDLFVAVATAEP